MKKVTMYLPERLIEDLQVESGERGISMSELVRRVLDKHIEVEALKVLRARRRAEVGCGHESTNK